MGLELKAIGELKGMKFFIPSYQRGYRWTKQQVEDLLDDIQEFIESKANWYYLQPLVIKKIEESDQRIANQNDRNDWHEVTDGQQRLTTIFIILKYLGKNLDKNLLEIEYETRKGSGNFLQNKLEENDGKNESIDYHHMSEAYQTIQTWLKEKEGQKEAFKQKLLQNVEFVWYEIPENENAYTVFKRLNSGKLSLTNSELIKAVILNDEDKEQEKDFRQEDIAREWENIENHLEDDNLWYFINPAPKSKNTNLQEWTLSLRQCSEKTVLN